MGLYFLQKTIVEDLFVMLLDNFLHAMLPICMMFGSGSEKTCRDVWSEKNKPGVRNWKG